MLFNSYEFVFVFLPITVALFFLFGRKSGNSALGWLIAASLMFYVWWRPENFFVILTSLVVNYTFARLILRTVDDPRRVFAGQVLLTLGVVLNILFLGYFKYTNFLNATMNDVLGTDFVLTMLILPLGISFFTFQQIAFLIDVHGGKIERFRPRDFALFVVFFPQLIAGPIVHYREMMPQFLSSDCRFGLERLAVGLSLFCFGLFKKVVLADGIAAHVSPVFATAAGVETVSLFPAWIAALGFTLQIYFDFSGYSDMAAGIAYCVGIRLPMNFDSPLKSSNIIDFWSRWHITLTRFLTAYIYNPLALWRTRKRLSRGRPGVAGRNTSLGAFLSILAGPTILTMFVSGLWHGAGFTFIVWGLLHGVYVTINHAWRTVGPRLWASDEAYEKTMAPVGFVITFLAVVVGMVFFRASSIDASLDVLRGMLGLNGIVLPGRLLELAGLGDALAPYVVASDEMALSALVAASGWVVALLGIALLLPNSLRVMAYYQPVLGVDPEPPGRSRLTRWMIWRPSLPWALFTAIIAAVAVFMIGGQSEFLYWQF